MSTTGDMLSPPAGSAKTNPFLSSPSEPVVGSGSTPTAANQKILDLFNTSATEKTTNGGTTPASDDLLGLNNNLSGNPFADSLFSNQQPSSQQQQQDQAFASFTNGEYHLVMTEN